MTVVSALDVAHREIYSVKLRRDTCCLNDDGHSKQVQDKNHFLWNRALHSAYMPGLARTCKEVFNQIAAPPEIA
jgi:hypothetical protein